MMIERVILALFLAAVVFFAPVAQAMKKGAYLPPNPHGYHYDHEWYADGDGDGVKETHFVLYKDSAGDSIFSATTKGHLWAWSLNSRGDSGSDRHRNYVIRDSNCDGVFDEAYTLDEQFRVPECAKGKHPGEPDRP